MPEVQEQIPVILNRSSFAPDIDSLLDDPDSAEAFNLFAQGFIEGRMNYDSKEPLDNMSLMLVDSDKLGSKAVGAGDFNIRTQVHEATFRYIAKISGK